jgi:hypothetical protein
LSQAVVDKQAVFGVFACLLLLIWKHPLYSATLTLYGGQLVPYELDKEAGWGLNVDNLQVWGVMNCYVTSSGWRDCLVVAADAEAVRSDDE